MELNYLQHLPLGGFNFDNCIRNKALASQGLATPIKTVKTGTTICGVIWKVLSQTAKWNEILIPVCVGWSVSGS